MKDRIKRLFCLLICAALCVPLCSCGLIEIKPANPAAKTETAESSAEATDHASDPEPAYPHVETAAGAFADELSRRAAEKIDPAVNKGIDVLNAVPDDGKIVVLDFDAAKYPPARDSLREDVKALYDIIADAVTQWKTYNIVEAELPGSNPYGDVINAVYAVWEDYPVTSLYYSDGGDYYSHKPRYFMPNDFSHDLSGDAEAIENIKEEVAFYNAVFARIIECMPEELTNFQKCLYFSGVIMYSCTYEVEQLSVYDQFQAYNALVKGEGICQAYTQAFRLLCRAAGVDCRSITGNISDTERNGGSSDHIWNAVETSGGLRFVDVTWMDSRVENSGGLFDSEYFMMDEEDLDFEGYLPDWSKLQ